MADKERDELVAAPQRVIRLLEKFDHSWRELGSVVAQLQLTLAELSWDHAQLSDLLRWRDTRVEQPTAVGEYMTASSKRGTCQCIQRYADGEWDSPVNYWRPVGPLPGGER